ncbi:MAG: hypothetical protein WCD42_06320 [Rhizomicrobium sp.]
MRRLVCNLTFAALFLIATLLAGLASRGTLPNLSWPQQLGLYLVLIGAMVGIALVAGAIAILQNWLEK